MGGLCVGALVLALAATCCGADDGPRVLRATDFGLVGDGVADDGPAIDRMLQEALAVDGPVEMRFPAGRTVYVEAAPERYVFRLDGTSDVTLDGGECTFELGPDVRFLRLTGATRTVIRRLNVDFRPLPFADGVVVGVDAAERRLDVRLLPGVTMPPAGGPTLQDGEQAFFSMLHHDGPYGIATHHCWTDDIQPGPEPDLLSITAAESFGAYDQIEPGKWRISIPVGGIAHRFGPGACFALEGNDTLKVEDVELWSAPWMGFSVARNAGDVAFRRVNVRPKPGSGRLMSLWRDAFHVKGNSASLLWDDCELTGMNDDAFNISTHSSVVSKVISPTEFEVRQKFPLTPIPWHAGATLTAVDEPAARLLGRAKIVSAERGPEPDRIQGLPAAPIYRLTLARKIEGLTEGTMVWDAAQCNPDTTLRNCRINMSCRMQSPMRLEGCEVTALLWFYAEHVEGGFPHHVRVSDCALKRGRGNPRLVVSVSGAPQPKLPPEAAEPPRAVHHIEFTENEFWGDVAILGAQHVRLTGNRFLEPGASVTVGDCIDVSAAGNTGPDRQPADIGR